MKHQARKRHLFREMRAHILIVGENPTVGELSKMTNRPYSSVRRDLIDMENKGLIEQEVMHYKSTGKRVFWATQKGKDWCFEQLELGL